VISRKVQGKNKYIYLFNNQRIERIEQSKDRGFNNQRTEEEKFRQKFLVY
jgi:hypothetical protein